ncbi:hypothetical protein M0804_002769 [Polistes exclamans]|nr:hypothetical protein M0804_002769 [Polistes exclamans]
MDENKEEKNEERNEEKNEEENKEEEEDEDEDEDENGKDEFDLSLSILAGVLQGNILELLLYAIYKTDFPTLDKITIFTDDTVLLASDSNPQNATDILHLHTLER